MGTFNTQKINKNDKPCFTTEEIKKVRKLLGLSTKNCETFTKGRLKEKTLQAYENKQRKLSFEISFEIAQYFTKIALDAREHDVKNSKYINYVNYSEVYKIINKFLLATKKLTEININEVKLLNLSLCCGKETKIICRKCGERAKVPKWG